MAKAVCYITDFAMASMMRAAPPRRRCRAFIAVYAPSPPPSPVVLERRRPTSP
jgi:hypothetical protein